MPAEFKYWQRANKGRPGKHYWWTLEAANYETVTASRTWDTSEKSHADARHMKTASQVATDPGVKTAAGKPRFEVRPSTDGQYFWRLVDGDSVTKIAHSETYPTRQAAIDGVEVAKRNARIANP